MVARSRRSKPTPIGAAATFPKGSARSSSAGCGGAAKRNSAGRPRGQAGAPPSGLEPQSSTEEERVTEDNSEDQYEFKKKVAHRLLDALDEDELWKLADFLQSRGLIQQLPGGLRVVPSACVVNQIPEQGLAAPAGAGLAAFPGAEAVPLHVALAPSSEPEPELAPAQLQGRPAVLDPPLAEHDPDVKPQETASQFAQFSTPECVSAGLSSEVDESSATTLILRNLPPNFSQQAAQEWVDERGYEGLYDFLLWFPAKKTSRLNTSSYAFVNFRCTQDAQKFRQAFHLFRFSGADAVANKQWPLSIAIAKIQGFAENFLRFYRLTDERSPTLCQPFFDENAIRQLPPETQQEAAASSSSPSLDSLQDGPCTTLIIRNLPQHIESHETARQWLDEQVDLVDQYDFFCFFPAKRRRPDSPSSSQGLGYAFVNFKTTETAIRCAELLNGKSRASGDPVLNVVAARVQGLEQCRVHFSSLSDNGRVVLWTDPSVRACPRQYQ